MRKTKFNLSKLVFGLLFFVFIALFTTGNAKTVKATGTLETSNITYLGASIRLTEPSGIRFTAHVDMESLLSELSINQNEIDGYGFVVAFGDTQASDLTIGATVNGKRTLNGETSSMFSPETNDFTIVLKGFDSTKYLQRYTARAYITYGDNEHVYAKTVITRTIYDVASLYEQDHDNEYTTNICNTVETLLQNRRTIASAKSLYDGSGNSSVSLKGIITAKSSGSQYSLTLEDETGPVMLYRANQSDGFSSLLSVGSMVYVTGTITKYTGIYEITNLTSCTVLSGGCDISTYVRDVSDVFESGQTSYINSRVSGIIEYVSTTTGKMNFITANHSSVLLYVDSKWSSYTAENLTQGSFYYVDGIIGYYNVLELLPINTTPVVSISSITCSNLEDTYDLNLFDLTDLTLNITLSNGLVFTKEVETEMFTEEDINSLATPGAKDITASVYGVDVDLEFTLEEKEVSSINVSTTKNKYFIGDEIDLDSIELEVHYVDSSTRTIDVRNNYITSFDSSSVGNKSYTVTYGGKSANINYSVYKKIIIYDVYGAGGNSEALYKYDFAILYNNSNETVNLNNYYLYYASSKAETLSTNYQLSGNIYPNSYYLVRGKTNGENGASIDLYNHYIYNLDMSASSGKVALAGESGITALDDSRLLDYVSFSCGSTNKKSYQRTSLLTDSYSQVSVDIDYVIDIANLTVSDLSFSGLKTRYQISEEFNTNNLTVTAIYNSGITTIVDNNDLIITGFNSATEGTRELSITYGNYTARILYTVSDNNGLLDVDIYFIDLGDDITDCGESTYIKVGDDIDILIDCGETNTISANAVKALINTYCTDDKLEYVIASHGHSDHIGGMSKVLANYAVENVIEFDYKYGNTTESSTLIGIYMKAREKAEHIYTAYELITTLGNGSIFELEIASDIKIVFYNTGYLNTTGSDKNAQSVVCTFEAYGTRVLFTGDAEKDCEAVYAPLVGNIDILKVAHHGTYNATMSSTLNYLDPEVAIICNGNYLGNEYGHPTYDALNRLYTYDSEMLVYAITGARINSYEAKDTNGPGDVAQVLYGYKTSKRKNFYFKCDSPSDALYQRNGNIHISLGDNSYVVTSEFYNSSPLEIKNTDYYTLMVEHWND